jgi:hypothetical protein
MKCPLVIFYIECVHVCFDIFVLVGFVALPSQQSSGTTSLVVAVALAAASFVFSSKLRDEPRLVILAGFINSLVFLFTTLALGNLKKSGEVGWIDAIVAVVLACVSASFVHRIAVTTTYVFLTQ